MLFAIKRYCAAGFLDWIYLGLLKEEIKPFAMASGAV